MQNEEEEKYAHDSWMTMTNNNLVMGNLNLKAN